MTRDRIVETLTQWAYDNLSAAVAPRVLIVKDPTLEVGCVEITIRAGCGLPDRRPMLDEHDGVNPRRILP